MNISTYLIPLLSIFFFSCEEKDDNNRIKDDFYVPVIDPAQFTDSITNPYLPLTLGTVFSYQAQTDQGNQTTVVTVTSDTKIILGVTCVVVTDILKNDKEEIIENTIDWFAQDLDGNVWYFGEATQELENGQVTSTEGTWQAGVDGAQPGIVMPAIEVLGIPYRQEYLFNEAEDMGRAIRIGDTVTTPYGTFSNCLVTEEWTPTEPDVLENKYYAPGIGNIKTVMVQGGNETEELTAITH